ncbi:Bax inhibitor-1 family protein [Collinsella ihumii]|uniref:Bax inhibitor-1 family protein n=1 Tax=Collinsella ihumii TaxID=1720204 RepID=A0AAW7JQD3_9ACTN|nr:Bax inhibitor-1 family protein [Collinsella ihumii]MDN0069763.1 Bax inhibitor-1 family protein [Collinsella ihumii]
MNEIERNVSPLHVERTAPTISPRMFNLVIAGLIFAGFCVMGIGTHIVTSPAFMSWLVRHPIMYLVISLVGSIAGIVIMSGAVKRQSVARSLIGYALFVCTFGLLCSMAVSAYDLPTVNAAFTATAGITVVFGALGLVIPQVFRRLMGVFSVALLALLVVQLVMMFMGVDQTWLDIAIVVVFCGFIGYDMHQATLVETTLPNAVFMACNLFLDIMNVFMRLLNIFGNNR